MLSFKNEVSTCGLAFIVPIGDGCCIKARCFHGDEIYKFSGLPGSVKRSLAQDLLNQKGGAYEKCGSGFR